MPAPWDRLRHRRAPVCDPLETLAVQSALGRLAEELLRLDRAPRAFAHAHHVRAAEQAYEGVLRRAVALAGGDQRVHAAGDVVGLELDLASRGWRW